MILNTSWYGLLDVSVNFAFISEFFKESVAEINVNISVSLNILHDTGVQVAQVQDPSN